MAWQHYRLVFRLLSPLHIGYRRTGNLMETRRYVPGKNLWAALTARLVRNAGHGADGGAYREVGRAVHKHFRFGYLWPSLDRENPYFPWKNDDFDYLFLGSAASTALEHSRRAAQDGTLHDVEFIAPTTRTGDEVYLLGDLWVQDPLPSVVAGWQDALRAFALGGEQGYGWGRVRLEQDPQPPMGNNSIGGFAWHVDGQEIVLTAPADSRITAHAVAAGEQAVTNVEGVVEPLVGWERQESGGYRLTQNVVVAYAPGATVGEETTVSIGCYGIYKDDVIPGDDPFGPAGHPRVIL